MFKADSGFWELVGYVMWLIGSALFAVVSYRNGDSLSFVGSVLFFLGIAAVAVPLVHRFNQSRSQ